MEIKEIKQIFRQAISTWGGKSEHFTREDLRKQINELFISLERERKIKIDSRTQELVIQQVSDDFLGFGPLEQLINDQSITEIMINGYAKIYIERSGEKSISNVIFDDENHLRYIIEKMLVPTRRRVDESFPYVDFSLPNGSRVNVIIPPVAVDGAKVTIRKFLREIEKIDNLVALNTLSQSMADFLIACVKAKLNILFSGATGSGKTTTVEVLSSYIDPEERIITIEDALELVLQQDHVVRLLTRPPSIEGKGEVNLGDLFRNTLRMRPSRIILGEVRGQEAMDYIQALNSGHRGCLAVIHASNPTNAVTRLGTMALYAGLNLPSSAIYDQISTGIDIIVQQEQLADGTRKISHITEVGKIREDKTIELNDIFRYEIESMDEDFKVHGKFKALAVPRCFPIFKKKGINISENIFKE